MATPVRVRTSRVCCGSELSGPLPAEGWTHGPRPRRGMSRVVSWHGARGRDETRGVLSPWQRGDTRRPRALWAAPQAGLEYLSRYGIR